MSVSQADGAAGPQADAENAWAPSTDHGRPHHVVDTVITRGIDAECFDRFFKRHGDGPDEDLVPNLGRPARLHGGLGSCHRREMMLPVLEPISQAAKPPARSLGLAFQLTNFPRDIDEDLDRGWVYMPQDDLRLFDVDLERREVTTEWRAFLAYEIERNRALYSFADTGIAMLPPPSARCVGTARGTSYAFATRRRRQR